MSLLELVSAPLRHRAIERLTQVHRVRVLPVPYSAIHGSWEDNIALVAPGTVNMRTMLQLGKYFAQPPVPKRGKYSLVLLDHDKSASGDLAVEYCTRHSDLLQPASPYHLFGAVRHVGPLNQWLGQKHGPGIIASAPSRPFGWVGAPQVFTLWYSYTNAQCHGRVYPTPRPFPAMGLCAYIAR